MGLFDGLFSNLGRRGTSSDRQRVLEYWGLLEPDATDDPGENAGPFEVDSADLHPSSYDRVIWRKKLARILDELPESQGEWADFHPDARALGLGDDWIDATVREEFTLLIRRAVADSVVTDAEHRKIDLAHQLIGLSNAEAESIFHKVVAEAEKFFGHRIEGGE